MSEEAEQSRGRLASLEERAARCRTALAQPLDREHTFLLQDQIRRLDKLACETRDRLRRLGLAVPENVP